MSTTSAKVVAPSIRYRLVLDGTATTTPVVKSVAFWYLPQPEPNWVYDLSVVYAERVLLMDDVVDTQSMDTARATLAEYFRDQDIISFTDIDGSSIDALIWEYNEDYHVPGKAGEPKEGVLRMSILEVAHA